MKSDVWVKQRIWCFHFASKFFVHVLVYLAFGENLCPGKFTNMDINHVNYDGLDNRIENLELWSSRHPKGQRVQDKIAFAYELLRQYAPELLKEEVNGTDNLPEIK